MNVTQRITDIIVISQSLAELLTVENTALREHRPDEVQNLLSKKEELSRAYESRITGLAEHTGPEVMATVDSTLKSQLRASVQRMQVLSAENTTLLEVAMEVNRRVLHEVTEAVKSTSNQTGYTRSGTMGYPAQGRSQRNVSFSLDESF
jgi:hypothetical protein